MIWIAILTLALLLLGVPIAFVLGLGGTLGVWLAGIPERVIITRFFSGVDSFVFLAVPFYILAAELMNRSGITVRLIRLVAVIIGRLRGGTAFANIGTSILFAGISGSAVADAAGLGKVFMEAMPKEGYKREYAAAVTVSSSIVGPIIPPSGLAIIMAAVTGLSVVDLFLAGVVPGILMGGACAVIVAYDAIRGRLPKSTIRVSRAEIPMLLLEGLIVGLLPVVIVGGMVIGAFTATEGGGIAVAAAFILGFFVLRELTLAATWDALISAARISASIYLLVAAAAILSYALNLLGIAGWVTSATIVFADQPWLFLLGVFLLMLILGTFLDIGAAIVIFVPLLMPAVLTLGIDPVHMAMVVMLTLAIGLITPPVGVVLFVMMRIGNVRMAPLVMATLPFLIAQLVAIILITLIPGISTWLPSVLR
jgi:TRAP-type transport system large permease protein